MTLYHYFRSSSSYRVRIALNLKQLKVDFKEVHLLNEGGEQFFDEFTKLNPKAEVPLLKENNFALSQSVAIIEYLDETHPSRSPLYPTDTKQKALTRQAIEIINSGIQPIQNLAVLKKLKSQFEISDEDKTHWIQHFISQGFKALESFLQTHYKSEFLFSDSPGAFECFLIPQIYNAERFKLDMSAFPLIQKINKNCLELEAFKLAHPSCF